MPKLPEYVCANCKTTWGIALDLKHQVLVKPGPNTAGRWPEFYSTQLKGDVPRCCSGDTVRKR